MPLPGSATVQVGNNTLYFSPLSRIATDHNEDNTSSVLKEWASNVAPLYHRVLINATDSPTTYSDASCVTEWSDMRYQQVAFLRQSALDAARRQWADYLFVSFIFHNILEF